MLKKMIVFDYHNPGQGLNPEFFDLCSNDPGMLGAPDIFGEEQGAGRQGRHLDL
jgi:hypothetical protein